MDELFRQWIKPAAIAFMAAALLLPASGRAQQKMEIHSDAFAAGGRIPAKYACTGRDISPSLEWSGVPKSAKTLVLILDDPDAPHGTFVHWIVYNLDPQTTHIGEHVKKNTTVPFDGQQGQNDFGLYGYGGPCPPPGPPHHYRFRLFALNAHITPEPPTGRLVEKAMAGHIVTGAQMVGTFQR